MGSRRGRRGDDPSIAGAIFVDKPAGLTSHDVVGRVRRALGVRRVGHAGTLDPMATGVLVLGAGPVTRLLGIVGAHDKEYEATIRLGASTITDDREGEELHRADPVLLAGLADSRIAEAVACFVGDLSQRPSSVSAVKIDGKRSYQRVRDGEEVEIPARDVTVSVFEISEIRRSADFIDVDVLVVCSAGTYIRALARDLGESLGVGGHLTRLRRTRSGAVGVSDCVDIEEVSVDRLMPPADFARRELPVINIDSDTARRARQGIRIDVSLPTDSEVALLGPDEDLVAVVDGRGSPWRFVAVFPALGGQDLAGQAPG